MKLSIGFLRMKTLEIILWITFTCVFFKVMVDFHFKSIEETISSQIDFLLYYYILSKLSGFDSGEG